MTTTIETSPSPAPSPPRRRRRLLWAAISAVVVVAALAGLGIWWFFRDDAPDAVSLETATAGIGATTVVADDSASGTQGITGDWTVDTTIGTFDYEDSTGTFVGFRVQERLSGVGDTTAVGRTPEVSGSITIEGTTLTAATIEADMTALTTNDDRRNDKVQRALETSKFPTATFVLTEPIDLGSAAATGETVAVVAAGDLTIHGVTTPVSLPLDAQLVDRTIVVVGSLQVTFADYGVSVPDAPIVISAEDHGIVELQLLFRPA